MSIIHLVKRRLRDFGGWLIVVLATLTHNNLTLLGYRQKGIVNYGDNEATGEGFVVNNILGKIIKSDKPIFFDVGASLGVYSALLKQGFPGSEVFAFEPNPKAYEKIPAERKDMGIKFFNLGMGSKSGDGLIYDYKNQSGTEHASVHKQVFAEIHRGAEVEEIKFVSDTVDNFCQKNKIEKIDFLKIDTEGSELEVLNGAKTMLDKSGISVIQFEFNEMNMVSRVFLKDFYNVLKNYNIYRISPGKLIPLFDYKSENEIFRYQNFLAVNKTINLSI